MLKKEIWWSRPRKINDQKEERKVSFLELFYDLTFVVIISQLSHFLASHISLEGVLQFILLYCMIWLLWLNGSSYHDLHGNNDIRTRFYTFSQMICVAGMAVFIGDSFGEQGMHFASCFSAILFIQFMLWGSTGLNDPAHRKISRPYTFCYFIAFFSVLISIWASEEYRFMLWTFSVVSLIIFPLLIQLYLSQRNDSKIALIPISISLVERFGLITIIVLGEVIASVINGIAHHDDFNMTLAFTGILAMLIAIGIWWLYFDFLSLKLPKKNFGAHTIWVYIHIPLTMSITILGASTLDIVGLHHELTMPLKSLVIISLVIVYLSISMMLFILELPEKYAKTYQIGKKLTFLAAVATACLYFVPLDTVPFLVIVILIMFMPIYQSIKAWIKSI